MRRRSDLRRPTRRWWSSKGWAWLVVGGLGALLFLIVLSRGKHPRFVPSIHQVGLQWMLSLYNNKLNGILADEMGLGKTV